MLQLGDRYELKDFVETGTYYGSTASWAAVHFHSVITIEYSREIYEETATELGKKRNISCIFGDSRLVLKNLVPRLNRPTVFWLDSHWSGGKTYGERDECPVIEEICAINTSQVAHFLFIDDARLFTSPPPQPHRVEHWPSIEEIIGAIVSGNHNYYIVIIGDVIVAVPGYAKESVASYCQRLNTRAWEEYGRRLEESPIKQGGRLIGEGFTLVSRGLHAHLRSLVSKLAKR